MKYAAHEFVKVVQCLVPSTYTVVLTTGAAIDTKGYSEALVVLSAGVAKTAAELDVKVYEGDTSTPATLVAGSTFTQITPANENLVQVGRLDLSKRKRYISVTAVADGTNQVRAGVNVILINPKYGPATQDETIAFNL